MSLNSRWRETPFLRGTTTGSEDTNAADTNAADANSDGASPSDWNMPPFSGFIDDDDGALPTTLAGTGGSATSGSGSVTFTVGGGSGLVFHDTITSGFSQAFENSIVSAEQTLAANWTNSITLNISFSASNQGNTGGLASNSFYVDNVSYAALRTALRAHDSGSSYGLAAAASLPLTDPNPAGGNDWMLPEAYARMLGLVGSGPSVDDYVSLNTFYNWNYGQDVADTLMHEISEGAMGRVGGLGDQNSAWSTMDLFRFNAAGNHDYTDGRDGAAAYFSYNGGQWLSSAAGLSFNNEYAPGRNGAVQVNSGDTADWNQVDVFGTGQPGETNTLSQTDLTVMDALGWTPPGASSPSSLPAGTTANMVTETTSSGGLQVYNIGDNAFLGRAALGSIPTQQQLLGSGNLSAGGTNTDLLMRDSTNDNLAYYDIRNNQLVAAGPAGNIGSEWKVLGLGDFSGNAGETDMLMRDVNNNLQYFDIQQNRIVGSGAIGNIGSEWQVLGFGDFSENPNETDMLMRDTGNNNLEYFDIRQNQIVDSGAIGNIGSEWQVLGFGDFSENPNESDMLMRDTGNNNLEYFDIRQNQIVGSGAMGNIGSEWQVMGFANFTGSPNESDMLMRDTGTNAVDCFDIQHNQIVANGSMGNISTAETALTVADLNPTGS